MLPQYSYIYLGDNARAPYGARSNEVIYNFTEQGVTMLLRRGAKLVVLACNSASAVALQKLQQDFLPTRFPDRKILGIVIPTAEEVHRFTKTKEVGLVATEATIDSKVYEEEICKIDSEIKLYSEACPLLVPVIEAGEIEWEGTDLLLKKYLSRLFARSAKIDVLILGCTHYPIIEENFKKFLPRNVTLLTQGKIVAEKLADYLKRHPEVEKRLEKDGERQFLTTDDSERLKRLSQVFYGDEIEVKSVRLG